MTPTHPEQTSESRARRKIREAAERHGLEVEFIDWQPIGYGSEMGGARGGWEVEFKDGGPIGYALGYTWQEVIEWIDSHVAEEMRS